MHHAFASWLAESDRKPIFTHEVLTGSCDVCKAGFALATSLPPTCCIHTLLVALGLAVRSPGNL